MSSRFLLCTLIITLMLMASGCSDDETDDPLDTITEDVSDVDDNVSDVDDNVSDVAGNDATGNAEDIASELDYRQEMRNFVIGISTYSKQKNPGFIIIPQNGQELLTLGGDPDDPVVQDYAAAIDGIGREDLFFGYDDDNVPTGREDTENMASILDIARNNGIAVLVTDYCWSRSYVDSSYRKNAARGYVSFAADRRDLNSIPAYPAEPYNVNDDDALSLTDSKNFLYIIDPGKFDSKGEFLEALQETDYDMILIDMFYEDTALKRTDVERLKTKSNGGSRLVVAYMSIGEAEDYRYYWDDSWDVGYPMWLEAENPDWEGNYRVRYWDGQWQAVIYGNEDSYLDMIINKGFDGVYLDIVDAFEYFEQA